MSNQNDRVPNLDPESRKTLDAIEDAIAHGDGAIERIADAEAGDDETAVYVVRHPGDADALTGLRLTALCIDDPALDREIETGADVVLVNVPRLPEDIARRCRRVRHMALPPQYRTAAEVVDWLPSAPRAWDEAEREGLRMRFLAHVGIRARPIIERNLPPPPPTTIGAAWMPLRAGLLDETPPPRKWLLRHPDCNGIPAAPGCGDGFAPAGKVIVMSAAGGVGKTLATLQLAVSAITGRPWLNQFHVAQESVGKAVALLLGEEDAEEIHRRLDAIARAMQLTRQELRDVERLMYVLPLSAKPAPLLVADELGVPQRTAEFEELRRRLQAGGPWSLVGIDPAARFMRGIESNNDTVTMAVQHLEALGECPGSPGVWVNGHTSKAARTGGRADHRGVTGLPDAARLALTLANTGHHVEMALTKSNLSRPWSSPLKLERLPTGILQVVTADSLKAEDDARQQANSAAMAEDVERVVTALLKKGGRASSIDQIVRWANMKLVSGRAAVRDAMDAVPARIVNIGTSKRPAYVVPEQGGGEYPIPPGTSGRRPGDTSDGPTVPEGLASRDVKGRRGDVGTSSLNGTLRSPDDGMPEQPGGRRRKGVA